MANAGQQVVLMRMRFARCPLENGVAPCTATSDCANTFFTCQSRCDYVCNTEEFWFATNCSFSVLLPLIARLEIPSVSACISSCQHAPVKLETGSSFSKRGTWTVCLEDKECASTPSIGALIETTEYVQGLPVDIFIGDSTMQSLDQFIEIHGVLDTYSIATRRGGCEYCLKIKDPFQLADGGVCGNKQLIDQAGDPVPLTLGVQLDGLRENDNGALPDDQVGNSIINQTVEPSANNNDCMNTAQYACIGKEIVRVRGVLDTTINRWRLDLIERGVCGTEIEEHEVGEPIMISPYFEDIHVADMICRVMTECMNLDGQTELCCDEELEPRRVIDYAAFEKYKCNNPLFYIREPVVICNQEDAADLLEEAACGFLFSLVYDGDRATISDARPPEPNSPDFVITSEQMVKNTLSIEINNDYVTDSYINYSLENWAESVDTENTRATALNVSGDSLLEPCDRKRHRIPKQSTKTTRFIGEETAFLAKVQAQRIRCQKQNATREICFDIPVSIGRDLTLGSYGIVDHDKTRRWDGSNNLWRLISKRYRHRDSCMELCLERSRFDINSLPFFSCDNPIPQTEDECDNNCYEVY